MSARQADELWILNRCLNLSVLLPVIDVLWKRGRCVGILIRKSLHSLPCLERRSSFFSNQTPVRPYSGPISVSGQIPRLYKVSSELIDSPGLEYAFLAVSGFSPVCGFLLVQRNMVERLGKQAG